MVYLQQASDSIFLLMKHMLIRVLEKKRASDATGRMTAQHKRMMDEGSRQSGRKSWSLAEEICSSSLISYTASKAALDL
jgi:hypothetical protein